MGSKRSISSSMRPDWDEYFFGILEAVKKRSTCHRSQYGAVITRDNVIMSTGYNGAPGGIKDCLQIGFCERIKKGIPHGENIELCRASHAEMNAIIYAGREKSLGGTLYIQRTPCFLCCKMIINAGIRRVVFREYYEKRDGLGLLLEAGIIAECKPKSMAIKRSLGVLDDG